MHAVNAIQGKGRIVWQKAHGFGWRYYVVFMVKPFQGPRPYLCVVDDYGTLQAI
jgi:hypothetical protein